MIKRNYQYSLISDQATKIISLFIALTSVLVISIFIYDGLFAVPSADDYAYAFLVKNQGFWQSQIIHYLCCSGRYTATFLITLFGKFNLKNYWLVPVASLSLVFGSFFFLYWTVFFKLRKNLNFYLFAFSFFALYLSSSIAGHGVGVINEGFFWLSGAATYQFGAFAYFMFLGCSIWIIRNKFKIINLILLSVFLFLSIGSNETLMALSFGTSLLMFIAFRSYNKSSLSFALILSVLFSFIVILSPGNRMRLSMSNGGHFFSALGICIEKLVETSFYSLTNPLMWLFVIYFFQHINELKHSINQITTTKIFYIFLAILIYCLYFPVAFSLNSGAPDRLVSFIGFIGFFGSIFIVHSLFFRIKNYISSKNSFIVILSLITIISFSFTLEPLWVALKTIPTAYKFHTEHKKRDSYVTKMHEQGKKSVLVYPIPHNHLLMFRDLDIPDHSIWYAKYFGVDTVKETEQSH